MNIAKFIDSFSRDLRHSLRSLLRRPSFALAAVLTLALGIGATTAIFSVVYSVLIKPLPYPNAAELVSIRHSRRNADDLPASSGMYLTYRDENRTFADIGLWREDSATLTDRGTSARVRALRVTDGTLRALGVQPMRGRGFTAQESGAAAAGPVPEGRAADGRAAEGRAGEEPASDESVPVILSYAFWQQRFGGDEAALGRALSIDSQPAQVVGIMPPDFSFLDMTPPPDVLLAERLDLANPSWFRYQMLARLRPGATLADARADVERMLPIWLAPAPAAVRDAFGRIRPVIRPLQDDLVGSVSSALWVLMGAIGTVLLIACANIANLMLVRTDARRQELAMRAALGAGPARIARELLAESLVLGAGGGALGLGVAYVGLQGLIAIGPSDLPRLGEIAVYPPVLAFTAAVSLASTLVFGSIAAFKHAVRSGTPAIGAAHGAHGASASREQNATRSALVVVQVALALVLIVSAALMIRSFEALRNIDPGFSDAATIQTAGIWMPTGPAPDPAQSSEWTRIEREIADKIAALPGVASVGFVSDLPIEWPGTRNTDGYAVEGQPPAAEDERPQGLYKFVSPGYFEAMGTRLIAGRNMTWSDIDAGGRVAVISEDLAREIAADPAAAVGKRLRFGSGQQDAWREVIGVVQSIHEDGLYEAPPAMVYWPVLMEDMFDLPEAGTPIVTFAIRSERAGTASLAAEIRQAVRSVSGSVPVAGMRTMADVYAGSLARTSFTLVMLAIAGGMALLLGVVGIYAVIAYVVSQRTREIGIRSALGAEPRDLVRAFVLHGLALSGVGAVVGLVAASALARLMSSVLFGVRPTDPAAYAAAFAVIIAAAALATYLPARRAAAVDPIDTLKAE